MNFSEDCPVPLMERYHTFFRVPCPPSFLDYSRFRHIVDGQNLSLCDVSAIELTCGLESPTTDAVLTPPSICDMTCVLLIVSLCCALFISLIIIMAIFVRRSANGYDDEKKVINNGKPVDL